MIPWKNVPAELAARLDVALPVMADLVLAGRVAQAYAFTRAMPAKAPKAAKAAPKRRTPP